MTEKLAEVWNGYWHSGFRNIDSEMNFALNSHQGRVTFELLKKYAKGSRVLEAGSGLGNWVFVFEKMGYRTIGIDLSLVSAQTAQEYARANGLNSDFLVGDLRLMPVEDNFFEVIVSYGVIEHFPDPQSALKEFYRVLKPGGACLITAPNPFAFHRLIGRHVLNLTKSYKLGYVGYEEDYTPKELSRLLQEAGFVNTEYGVLSDGAGMLFGEFWGLIPLVGRKIKRLLTKFAHVIESRQNTVGGGSFAIGYKIKP